VTRKRHDFGIAPHSGNLLAPALLLVLCCLVSHYRRQTIEKVCTCRENIQAQGFCGLDDKTCAQINYPLRLSPAICMVWAAVPESAVAFRKFMASDSERKTWTMAGSKPCRRNSRLQCSHRRRNSASVGPRGALLGMVSLWGAIFELCQSGGATCA
jgi:hypothetical protein